MIFLLSLKSAVHFHKVINMNFGNIDIYIDFV